MFVSPILVTVTLPKTVPTVAFSSSVAVKFSTTATTSATSSTVMLTLLLRLLPFAFVAKTVRLYSCSVS